MLNRVHLGDCLVVMAGIQDGTVDAVITDLPYGTTRNPWDEVIPFGPMWEEFWRVLKPGGVVVSTCQGAFTARLICSQLDAFRYKWTWAKSTRSNHLNAKRQPLRRTEDVAVFYRDTKAATYNPQGVRRVDKVTRQGLTNTTNYGRHERGATYHQEMGGYPTDLLEIPSPGRTGHPTEKPVALFEYLIRTYTHVGDTVLDPAIGRGTTAIAALNTGRHFIGIERDPVHYLNATGRVENWRSEQATKGDPHNGLDR